MRVSVDLDVCASTGGCASIVPDVFRVQDDGLLHVLQPEPPEELRALVEEAADLCPTAAITVEG